MKCTKWCLIALALAVSANVWAQTAAAPKPAASAAGQTGAFDPKNSLDGYTRPDGTPYPKGGTELAFGPIENGQHTIRVSNLSAWGDRENDDAPGRNKMEADLASNPKRFQGAELCMMELGKDYGDTGPYARNVDLTKAKTCGKIDPATNSATLRLAAPTGQCKPVNWVIKFADGHKAWGAHPGWSETNDNTGPWTVLAEGKVGQKGDPNYPATVYCKSADGKSIVPPRADQKPVFAKAIQRPSFSTEERKKEVESKDRQRQLEKDG